jgi:hypothetical protein
MEAEEKPEQFQETKETGGSKRLLSKYDEGNCVLLRVPEFLCVIDG